MAARGDDEMRARAQTAPNEGATTTGASVEVVRSSRPSGGRQIVESYGDRVETGRARAAAFTRADAVERLVRATHERRADRTGGRWS